EGIQRNMQALANDAHCAAPPRPVSAATDTLFANRCEAVNRPLLRIPLRSGRVFIVSRRPFAIGLDGRSLDWLPLRAAPCERHTIAAGSLGAIKRLIRHFQKSVEIGICAVRDCDAYADGSAKRMLSNGTRGGLEGGSQAFCQPQGVVLFHVREQHHELLASNPREQIRRPQLRGSQSTKCGKHLIPGLMPERVVDAFEAIEIEHQKGCRLPRMISSYQQPLARVEKGNAG